MTSMVGRVRARRVLSFWGGAWMLGVICWGRGMEILVDILSHEQSGARFVVLCLCLIKT